MGKVHFQKIAQQMKIFLVGFVKVQAMKNLYLKLIQTLPEGKQEKKYLFAKNANKK